VSQRKGNADNGNQNAHRRTLAKHRSNTEREYQRLQRINPDMTTLPPILRHKRSLTAGMTT